MKKGSNTVIECNLCHKEFKLTSNTLEERKVILRDAAGKPLKEIIMTTLTCPCCGKDYPVVIDDEKTLPLLAKLRKIVAKELKQMNKGFNPSPELVKKHKELNWKLDFNRQKLADEYNMSFYQLKDGTMVQLDYCYHAQ